MDRRINTMAYRRALMIIITVLAVLYIMIPSRVIAGRGVENEAPYITPTASELIQFANNTVGYGFIYGAYGQICDVDFRYGRASVYPEWSELMLTIGKRWDGLPVYDCMGLIKAFAIEQSVPAKQLTKLDVTTRSAWDLWLSEFGDLTNAILQPGMLLFRLDGSLPEHVGVYIGSGRIVHARGTRWGVVNEAAPATFTHYGRLKWLDYDLPYEDAPVKTGIYLDIGNIAQVQTDNLQPVVVSSTMYMPGRKRNVIGRFADGALLTVVDAGNNVCRLVEGIDINGLQLRGYVRLASLRMPDA